MKSSGNKSSFGGGWAHDSSGTLSNTRASSDMRQQTPASGKMHTKKPVNSFGDGWAHNDTGTLHYKM